VDKKAELSEFKSYTAQRQNVHYTEERIKVFWGGFSMVQAALILMQEAIKSGIEFKYAIWLSGSHYPIKSNDYIYEFLRNSESEYLQFAETRETGSEFRTQCYCLYDYALFYPRTKFFDNRFTNQLVRIPGRVVDYLFKKVIPVLHKRKLIGNINPYAGPNWWVLTKPCIEYVLEYVRNNNSFLEFYRFSIQPDETFFHTIICNSAFKVVNSDVTLLSLRGYSKERQRYADLRGLSLTFTKCSPRGVPKTLCKADFNEIRQENNFFGYPQLFARKFDCEVSAELLDLIDKHILGRPRSNGYSE
jgi:hypothetical protein